MHWREKTGEGQVQVVVLGDIGRSPRMQYHCLSLIEQKYDVELIGYGGSSLIQELRDSSKLHVHFLPDVPSLINGLPRILRYIFKVLFQSVTMFWVILRRTKKPSHTIVQTPPAIPSQFVMVVICLLRGSKLIIDYHNYASSLMALTLGKQSILVRFTSLYEKFFSHWADARLCVSNAMKKDIQSNWGVSCIIMYDRPPSIFHPLSLTNKHELFLKLSKTEPVFKSDNEDSSSLETDRVQTVFSESTPTGGKLRTDRPFLLISSTSWTEDEDFNILLNALEVYDEKASNKQAQLPQMVCIITGKGPLKTHYENIIVQMNFKNVKICTMWLASEDYPALLASADLGVCLHKSSSGLDLPMKIVDMFGSGLPVCAVHFECLHELLRDEHNGVIFHDHNQLAEQLERLCRGFPAPNPHLTRFRDNLVSFQSLRWDHYWRLHILPLLSGNL